MAIESQKDTGVFTQYDLAPGMRLFVAPTAKFKRTQVSFFVHDQLSADRVALGGLLPFIQKRGTTHHPTGADLERASDKLYNASVDGGVHKIGDRQILEYSLNIPADRFVSEPVLGQGLKLLAEVIYDPVVEGDGLKGEYVEQEKRFQIGRVKALINDKIRYAFFRSTQEMFKGEPFAEYELGTEDQIEKATPESLLAHNSELIETRPVDIYVVGDVDQDNVRDLVEKELIKRSADAAGKVVDLGPATASKGEGEPRYVTQEEQMNQGWLVIGLRSDIQRSDPDRYGMLFFNGILGGFPHSKLFVNVRERASLAYSAFSFYDSNKGIISAVAGIDVNKYDQALDIINEQIDDVRAGRFSDEDLESTRRAFMTRYRMNLDSAGGRIFHHLGGLTQDCPETIEEVLAAVSKLDRSHIQAAADRVRKDLVYFLKGTQ